VAGTVTNRPAPRKSGRAPKREPDEVVATPLDSLERVTLDALLAAVFLQNLRSAPDTGTKSSCLAELASDLQLALLQKMPKDHTDRLCLDLAAMALRLLEQGDGH
jgi:hypothetical protein